MTIYLYIDLRNNHSFYKFFKENLLNDEKIFERIKSFIGI